MDHDVPPEGSDPAITKPSAADEASEPLLFTIGYSSRPIDKFIAALKSHGIEDLIDVRTAPYSKFKPEFSREALRKRLETDGIRYLFFGDALGGQPPDPACLTDGKVDYAKVRVQSFFREGLDRLKKTLAQLRRTALMCSEGRPEQCHRSKLIGEALSAEGVRFGHIDEDGAVLTQTQVIDRLTKGQLDLFGPTPFTSRKRYPPRASEGSPDHSH